MTTASMLISRNNDIVKVYDEDLAYYLVLKVINARKYKFQYRMGNDSSDSIVTFDVNVRGWRVLNEWTKEYLRRKLT